MHHRTDRSRLRRSGRVAALAAVGAALVVAMVAPGAGVAAPGGPVPVPPLPTAPAAPDADHRPNVVLILTDDQRAATYRTMPNVNRLLRARGTTYTRAMVPTSLCCPSRSTILTGLYAHSS